MWTSDIRNEGDWSDGSDYRALPDDRGGSSRDWATSRWMGKGGASDRWALIWLQKEEETRRVDR